MGEAPFPSEDCSRAQRTSVPRKIEPFPTAPCRGIFATLPRSGANRAFLSFGIFASPRAIAVGIPAAWDHDSVRSARAGHLEVTPNLRHVLDRRRKIGIWPSSPSGRAFRESRALPGPEPRLRRDGRFTRP